MERLHKCLDAHHGDFTLSFGLYVIGALIDFSDFKLFHNVSKNAGHCMDDQLPSKRGLLAFKKV
jgi:hypothetical protein